MIEIVRFDHISMVVPEIEPQAELLERLFGFRPAGRFEDEGYDGMNLRVPGTSGVGWEVLAPNRPDSYLHRFLASPNGPGLHHVAIQVRDLAQAAEAMRAEGIEPWAKDGVREQEPSPRDVAGEIAGEPPVRIEDGLPATPRTASDEPPRESGQGYEGAGSRAFPTGGPTGPRAGYPAGGQPRREHDGRSVAYIHPRQGGNGFLFQLYTGESWHDGEPFEDEAEHTLGITAVNHLAHAHYNIEQLAGWYRRVFGLETVFRSPVGDGRGFATQVLETPTRQLRWEILQPSTPDSFVRRFLEQRGPAIHHVTFEVGDWERAISACAYHRVEIFGVREGATDGVPWREAFVHPRNAGGMLVQFFWQAEPGVWV